MKKNNCHKIKATFEKKAAKRKKPTRKELFATRQLSLPFPTGSERS